MADGNSTPDEAQSSFADLLKEIATCPQAEAKDHLLDWRRRLDEMWPADGSNEEYWELLVEQLLVPEIAHKNQDVRHFAALLAAQPESCRSLDSFLCNCAYTRLNQCYWTQHGDWRCYSFVAGCVNLAVTAKKFNLAESNDDLFHALQNLLKPYWGSLVHIAICSPEVFEKTATGYRLGKVIDLQSARSLVDMTTCPPFLKHTTLKSCMEHAFEIITFITGRDQRQLIRDLVPFLIKERDTCGIAKAFFLEDSNLSRQFAASVAQTEWEADRAELIRAWAHYLVADDAFEFCWWVLCWTPRADQFGKSFGERFAALRKLLLDNDQSLQEQMFHRHKHREWKESDKWRRWYVSFFRAVCGLVERDRWSRVEEEIWIRQAEAAELLIAEQSHLKAVVHGILAKGKDHWDVFDPIVLGLPSQPTIECLEQYVNTHDQAHDDYFHAKRSLAHMRGEMPVSDPGRNASGLMGAVKNLIIASRTRDAGLAQPNMVGRYRGRESLAWCD